MGPLQVVVGGHGGGAVQKGALLRIVRQLQIGEKPKRQNHTKAPIWHRCSKTSPCHSSERCAEDEKHNATKEGVQKQLMLQWPEL